MGDKKADSTNHVTLKPKLNQQWLLSQRIKLKLLKIGSQNHYTEYFTLTAKAQMLTVSYYCCNKVKQAAKGFKILNMG